MSTKLAIPIPSNDIQFATAVQQIFGGDIRFLPGGGFFIYDGMRFLRDRGGVVVKQKVEAAWNHILREILTIGDDEERHAALSWRTLSWTLAEGGAPVAPARLRVRTGLGEAEIQKEINSVIAETGASGVKDMGKVMTALKSRLAGRADMAKVSALVKAKLSG